MNRDGRVAPIDALIIVNRLNDSGPGSLSTPTSLAGLTEYFYIDTNADRSVAPVDVIRVVNFLNGPSNNLEGERATSVAVGPVVTLLRNVNSPPPTSSPKRQAEAQKHEEARWQIPVVWESALRSNATIDSRVGEYAVALDEILDRDDSSWWEEEIFESP